MLATGIWPPELDAVMRPKFRGPINVRIDLQSLTTTLHRALLPKLQFWKWNGLKPQGGPAGHWGWVPRRCLPAGGWERAWREKERELRVACFDPDHPERKVGESAFQFVSTDMDAQDLASGEFDLVIHDEPPPFSHWRENQARVLSVGGRLFLGMTFRDDESIPLTWIIDEVWDPGQPGPGRDPDIECIELDTLENRHIDLEAVRKQADKWDEITRQVRIKGKPIHLSSRVHPLFTEGEATWSFAAGQVVDPVERDGKLVCPVTGSDDLQTFSHVAEDPVSHSMPTLFFLDPHPRKPHMMIWVQVNAADDLYVVAEAEVTGDAVDVKRRAHEIEVEHGLPVTDWWRWGDPNMLRTPTAKREIRWEDEFRDAGLPVQCADDGDVGRARVNEYLRPDPHTRRPRLLVHPRCRGVIHQMKRFAWDNYKKSDERDVKQIPKPKFDDYPALLRYCLNLNPEFATLTRGVPIIGRGGRLK